MIILKSWGFKYGEPKANFKIDVSYFKNPWREKIAKENVDACMIYMDNQEGFEEITENISELIASYERLYPKENLIFAFCCSAGEYRSPAAVRSVQEKLLNKGFDSKIE